jgi:tripartite-type tricarboxylate transporter receptor subunit TctC
MRLCPGLLLGALLAAASPSKLQAQDATPFYKDKQIRIILSAGVAGGYMEYARTLADHMGKHIAGHPTFIAEGQGPLLRTGRQTNRRVRTA